MNKQYALPLTAVLGGAAAWVLRLLQNRTGFEPDTGLPVPGDLAGWALVLLLIGLGAALLASSRLYPQEENPGPALPRHFSTENAALLTVPMCGVFLVGLSGLADLAEGLGLLTEMKSFSRHAIYAVLRAGGLGFTPRGQLLMGALDLASAAALFLVLSGCRRRERETLRKLPAAITLIPVGALVIRLVLTYRIDSVNPSLSMYYVELLALVSLTLGFYRLSSFAFQAGQTRRFSLYAGASAVLCIASLADGSAYLSSMLLLFGFLCFLGYYPTWGWMRSLNLFFNITPHTSGGVPPPLFSIPYPVQRRNLFSAGRLDFARRESAPPPAGFTGGFSDPLEAVPRSAHPPCDRGSLRPPGGKRRAGFPPTRTGWSKNPRRKSSSNR